MTEAQILQQQDRSADASPAKSLGGDLKKLRQLLRTTARDYLRRLENELEDVAIWTQAQARAPKLSRSTIRDLRDMVTLIRKLEVKPAKGRRKDLKKLDETISELRELIGEDPTR